MAVRWTDKVMGKIKLHRIRKDNEGKVYVDVKFDVDIHVGGNCIAVFIYEYRDKETKLYNQNFWGFIDDKKHVSNLIKSNKPFFGSDEIVNINLNLAYEGATDVLKLFTRLGAKVICTYKEPKATKKNK